jgi:hypothetical protein
MANDNLTNYVMRKLQFKLLDYRVQIHKDRLHGMKESLVVIQQDNLTAEEFKNFILEVEKSLKNKYDTKRMPMLSKSHYILKVEDKLPEGV